jgi:hypothetical protein
MGSHADARIGRSEHRGRDPAIASDFSAAARRHDRGAALLQRAQRVATAEYLYGLSAECSLKAVLLAPGYSARIDRGQDGRLRLA